VRYALNISTSENQSKSEDCWVQEQQRNRRIQLLLQTDVTRIERVVGGYCVWKKTFHPSAWRALLVSQTAVTVIFVGEDAAEATK
jgi:hypothetical protein